MKNNEKNSLIFVPWLFARFNPQDLCQMRISFHLLSTDDATNGFLRSTFKIHCKVRTLSGYVTSSFLENTFMCAHHHTHP